MSASIKNADIPRVGAGTPGGTWLRRYWLPVSRSDEIFDIPKSVKVLGEELVLFRAESGELGLVGQDCPHRGASLEYADVEANPPSRVNRGNGAARGHLHHQRLQFDCSDDH